ncbi:hypothetical protein [Mitsuokella multacida]|uniref:hypothetical protein n=1 Tax=Mitsuokella multacida TaxID=52226 RepID=UPI00242D7DBA|nr:hypothetical protein [Mitsuokella multacida]
MSMFLAPIHFMVYGKNQLQEQLIASIAERAAAEGWATAEALDAYCSHEDRPLDAIIDVSNIHGWLSNSIADVEHRLAALVTELLFGHPERLSVLEEVAYEEGKKQAAPADAEAGELFQYLTTHLVDGMPCDGVNMMRDQTAETFRWDKTADVHSHYWTEVEGSPAVYQALRGKFIEGLLSSTDYAISTDDGTSFILQKN